MQDPKKQVEEMLKKAQALKASKEVETIVEESSIIPVVQVEELPLLPTTTSNSLFLNKSEVLSKDSILKHLTPDIEKIKNLNLTANESERIKRSLGRMTTGAAAVVPMLCRGHACQPAGTMILTTKGEKAIETLNPIEDLIVPIDHLNTRNLRKNGKSFTLHTRDYKDKIYKFVNEEGFSFETTYDHILLAEWSRQAIDKFAIYLMQKGDNFRIGMTTLLTERKECKDHRTLKTRKGGLKFGPRHRLTCEKGEKLWILDIVDTKIEALFKEEYYSCKWGISQSLFIATNESSRTKWNGKSRWATQDQIDAHFKSLKQSVEIIKKHLRSINLDYEYPFINTLTDERKVMYTHSIFEIRACNFLSGYMEMGTYNNTDNLSLIHTRQKPNFTIFTKEIKDFSGIVYSLEVDKYHTYVANGIITHNCSYHSKCVDSETLVLTVKNDWVKIKDLQVFDQIYSINVDNTLEKDTVLNVISQGKKECFTVYTNNNNQITCTLDHKFKVWNYYSESFEWLSLETILLIPERYLLLSLEPSVDLDSESFADVFADTIESVVAEGEREVYDISVKNNKNFIANNLVVHNCDFYLLDKIEIGEECLLETSLIDYWTSRYMDEFDIDPNSITELHTISRLVEITVKEMRMNLYTSIHEQDLMQDFITSVDEMGNEIINKGVSTAHTIRESLDQRKLKILESLNATRERKAKLAIGQAKVIGENSNIASIRNALESLAIKLSEKTINKE